MTVGMLFVVLTASLEVTPLVGDHAVMQQGQPIPVWGTADGGALVTVEWTDAGGDVEVARTTVSDDGSWSVVLAARDWSADPATIRVTNGDVTWNAEDVLVGEVWIASGQSNMEWPVSRSNAKGDSAEAMTHAHVREFKVPHAFADVPQSTIHGQWAVAGPQTTPKFSAVAWHFARGLNQDLGMPVGIINSSWGGSRVEPWMSLDALDALRSTSPRVHAATKSWYEARSMADTDAGRFSAVDFDDSLWGEAVVPSSWKSIGLGDVEGTVFYRLSVWVPEHWAGKDLVLELGPIDDIDETFWDGHLVGGRARHDIPRIYVVPGKLVTPGRHVITVANTDQQGAGGFFGKRGDLRLYVRDAPDDMIPLAGPWRWKLTSSWSQSARSTPTVVSNAMIAPFEQLPVAGVIWYQGESNAGDPESYDLLFPAMIQDWRSRFKQPLPFYFVQLANLAHGRDNWHWPELREAQRRALSLPDTGMALCFDVGNPTDIHPTDKHTVGNRLARLAMHGHYGHSVIPEGPRPMELSLPGNGTAVVTFETYGGALSTRGGGPVRLVEVAGDDGVFHEASVVLSKHVLTAKSPAVGSPTQVRYGWRQDPAAANLIGADDLPASPFCLPSTVRPPTGGVSP